MPSVILLVVLQFVRTSVSNTISPGGIVIHHTALTRADARLFPGPTTMATIDGLHQDRGYGIFFWGGIYHTGYHYLILPDGTVETGRPEKCLGSHTRGHNEMLGICLVGNFALEGSNETPTTSVPTINQLQALARLVSDIRERYKIPCDKVYRHDDLNPETLCPGLRFPWETVQGLIGCTPLKE